MVKVQRIEDISPTSKQNGSCSSKSPSTQKITHGEDEQMEIIGFRLNKSKNYLTKCLYILSFGLLRLFFHWNPHIMLYSTHSRCSLDVAEKVMIVDTYKSKFKTYFVKDVSSRRVEISSEEERENTNGNVPTMTSIKANMENGKTLDLTEIRSIKCKKMMYIWNSKEKMFLRMVGLDQGMLNSDLHLQGGLTKNEQDLKRMIYGSNEINIPVQSIATLFFLEALTPFYIFQVFSVLLWVAESYYYYGIAIIIMSVYGIASSIIQTRTNQKNLKGTVFTEDTVTVCRGGKSFEDIKTSDLVPGDVIIIPSEGCKMQCDAVLLKGNCIVNESMLTGESVPVHKTALMNDNNYYREKEDSNHTLFSGTTVLQTKFCGDKETLAVVIRTGYLTTKGELVRSILYPPPADFKFDQDSYKFIGILSVIALLGFIYTVVTKISRRLPFVDIAIKASDLVTIAIPPALPIAMTVGKLYAIDRLKKKNIFCINSRVINVSGSVDCVCFDKTGTLTEDELDMWGVLPVNNGTFDLPIKDMSTMRMDAPLFKGMLTCHTLSIIDGKLCGYPLDLKMFYSTFWKYREPTQEDFEGKFLVPEAIVEPNDTTTDTMNRDIEIYTQFPFMSSLQRSSVICRDNSVDPTFEVYCKGSPEAIVTLSDPKTVPEDIFQRLNMFTTKGYRVIAMGTKTISVEEYKLKKISREDVETDLTFCGLLIMENRLKNETPGTIKTLKKAGLKTTMITGDNIQTAVSVGRECGIVEKESLTIEVTATYSQKEGPKIRYNSFDTDNCNVSNTLIKQDYSLKVQDVEVMCKKYQLVLTGKSWANIIEHFPANIPHIVRKGVVFSRMSSYQKQQLIEELKNLGYYVAMCGDGANDCAALKAAHLGISLSEAEASIAAPFTSREPNISCVSMIIREGRAALLTSFGVFKFIVCGSLAEFFCTVILYGIDCNLSSMQFLFLDIFLQLNLATFFGNTEACKTLYHKPPLTSILSFIPLMSMVLFMFLTIGFQIFAFYFVRSFSWYKPFIYTHLTEVSKCHENFSTFVISMFQYITMAILFSKGRPYRQPLYTNKKFTTVLIITTLICGYISLIPPTWVVQLLEMNLPASLDFRISLLMIAGVNLIVAFFVEEVLVDFILDKIIYPWFKQHRKSMKVDVNVEIDFSNNKQTVIKNVNEHNNGILSKKLNEEDRYIVTRC